MWISLLFFRFGVDLIVVCWIWRGFHCLSVDSLWTSAFFNGLGVDFSIVH